MKYQKLVCAGIFLCIFIFGSLSSASAQTGSGASFLTPPYATAYTDALAADSVLGSEIVEVLHVPRVGTSDVEFVYLTDRFYVIFDLSGQRKVYLFNYEDKWEDYQTQLSLNGIPPNDFSVQDLINCVLKYHTKS